MSQPLWICRTSGQRCTQEKRWESLGIRRVIDKLALPHFYSAPVTTHIMPK